MEPTEQEAADVVRLERRTRHERMRGHLRWLTSTRFQGKQVRLADALGVSPSWLSQYMKGRSQHREFSLEQLNTRHSDILFSLRRAELPTETPTASEAAASATAAETAAQTETVAAPRAPSKHSAAAPVSSPRSPRQPC